MHVPDAVNMPPRPAIRDDVFRTLDCVGRAAEDGLRVLGPCSLYPRGRRTDLKNVIEAMIQMVSIVVGEFMAFV